MGGGQSSQSATTPAAPQQRVKCTERCFLGRARYDGGRYIPATNVKNADTCEKTVRRWTPPQFENQATFSRHRGPCTPEENAGQPAAIPHAQETRTELTPQQINAITNAADAMQQSVDENPELNPDWTDKDTEDNISALIREQDKANLDAGMEDHAASTDAWYGPHKTAAGIKAHMTRVHAGLPEARDDCHEHFSNTQQNIEDWVPIIGYVAKGARVAGEAIDGNPCAKKDFTDDFLVSTACEVATLGVGKALGITAKAASTAMKGGTKAAATATKSATQSVIKQTASIGVRKVATTQFKKAAVKQFAKEMAVDGAVRVAVDKAGSIITTEETPFQPEDEVFEDDPLEDNDDPIEEDGDDQPLMVHSLPPTLVTLDDNDKQGVVNESMHTTASGMVDATNVFIVVGAAFTVGVIYSYYG